MIFSYSKNDEYEFVMRQYTLSKLAMYISFDEMVKYVAIVHCYDYECAEDVVSQLYFELNNIIFSAVPVKMSDILIFTCNYLRANKNICFCFLADFYVRNIIENEELIKKW